MRSRWVAGTLAALGLLTVLAPAAQATPAALGIVTTLAGDGYPRYPRPGNATSLYNPEGIVARNGGGFFTDTFNHRILRLDTNGKVDLVAGTGEAGFSGDGGNPQAARLNAPMGLAMDDANAIYFADRDNARVRKISSNGITTIAGNGGSGFGGDGGPATNAALAGPNGVAVDKAGNVYVVDTFHHRIRKVTPQGVISTVAGSGPSDPFGGAFAGDGGLAVNARLNGPTSVAVAGDGTLYIADSGNRRVRRVTPDGVISTYSTFWAGTVAVDSAGNLFITRQDVDVVMKVPLSGAPFVVAGNGSATTSGDGGPATQAGVPAPTGVSADTDGSVLITQADSHVRRVAPNGVISTPVGGGTGVPAVNGPVAGIAVDAGSMLFDPSGAIVFVDHYRIRRLADGVFSTLVGNGFPGTGGDGGPASQAQLDSPGGIVLAPDGSLYVSDGNVIRKVYPDGTIRRYAGTGTYGSTGDGGPATQATFGFPGSLALDRAGNLYLTDRGSQRIRRIDTDGVVTTVAGTGDPLGPLGDGGPATQASLYSPGAIAFDPAGSLYIGDTVHYRLRKVTNGIITTVAGNGQEAFSGDGGPATQAGLTVGGFAWDATGALYLSDFKNSRIRRITPQGVISTVAGTGVAGFNGDNQLATATQLNYPGSVLVGPDGSLTFADTINFRIRKITFNG